MDLTADRACGSLKVVKTTLDLPDALLHRAEAKAAERGIPLQQFVTEAVEEKLARDSAAGSKPWMAGFGRLREIREDSHPSNRVVEDESTSGS
jgi:hypothetical protein